MDTKLRILQSRFPGRSKLIESLYRSDTSFNSLSEDYCSVDEQIRKLKGSGKAISASDIKALTTLLSELEDEMILYFENAQQT